MKLLLKQNWFVNLLFTLIATTFVYLNYPECVKNLNTTYFADGNDGLQNYYGHWYHIKHDSAYMSTKAMNYPNGEFIYYTGVQLIPASLLKFVNDNIIYIADYWIGIQNFLMLSSIILCALFLFLIVRKLKISIWYSAVWALAITFLSPQLDRFGGHLSLSYLYFIPLIVYLIMIFNDNKKLSLSVLIAFTGFFAYTTHPYFFGMIALILLIYWFVQYISYKPDWKSHSLHFFLQFILPIIVIKALEIIFSDVSDRTNQPWGFLVYRAFPEGVFLPLGFNYGQSIRALFTSLNYVEWEGIAYVGLVAVIGSLFFFIRFLRYSFTLKFTKALQITDNRLLNTFYWASFVSLMFSFGLPFILGLEWLVDYMGPIKQMRGIGRFTWLYYYVINIVVAYKIWQWSQKKNWYKYVIILPCLMVCYDAYLYAKDMQNKINHNLPAFSDINNELPENNWVKMVNVDDYQALLTFPYYSIGSENIWVHQHCNSITESYYFGMKTGLPIVNIYYSRTSISQCYNNAGLYFEPYRELEIVNKFQNNKPILLFEVICNDLTDAERNLIKKGKLLFENSKFRMYSLAIDTLKKLHIEAKEQTLNQLRNYLISAGNSAEQNVIYNSFDSLTNNQAYTGNGCFSGDIHTLNLLWEGKLKNTDTTNIVSFWFGNVLSDVQLRSTIIVNYFNEKGEKLKEDWLGLQWCIRLFDENWGLMEYKLNQEYTVKGGSISIGISNFEKRKGELLVDELLIRPVNFDFFQEDNAFFAKNTRKFFKAN